VLQAIRREIVRRTELLVIAGLVLSVVAASAAAALTARALASPQARSTSCTQRGPIRLDNRSHLRRSVYCPNFVAPVYRRGTASNPYRKIDILRSTVSWFVCQAKSRVANPPFGAGRNHWWLWTQGDDHHRYGWFPANAIKVGGQERSIRGVPPC
jgi:hypothetical protein